MEKSELRKEYFRQYRKYQNNKEMEYIFEGLRKNLVIFFRNKRFVKVMAYDPLPSELPILAIFKELNLDIEVFVPVVKNNILIPISKFSGKYEKLHKMDYIIVPGLYVNESGYRLGRGKGYYDRILGSFPRFRTVFVCQTWQILKELPVDPWDKRVGFLLTESYIKMCF